MPTPRNRPRIAGQRRTPKPGTPDPAATQPADAPPTDALPQTAAEPTAGTEPGTAEPDQQTRPEDVTPTTSEAPETASEETSAPESATESEEEPEAYLVEPAGDGVNVFIGKARDRARLLERARERAESAPGSARSGLGNLMTAALGVVVVLTLTVAAVLGVKAWHGKQAEDARDQAAAAGRKAAETALSYDYRDLDKSFAAARATMTPDFAAKFDETAKVAGELATKTKATVKADVREVAVRDGDADRVTLIIFVNQTTTSTITKGSPRVDLNRTRFTMVRNDGRWLVQEIAGL